MSDIKERKNEWVVELEEKPERIPAALASCQDVVLDGYYHRIDILSHSFSFKSVYLRVFRRRRKRSSADKHHSNTYDLTVKGLKMVPELGIFLKAEDRRPSGQHQHGGQDVRYQA